MGILSSIARSVFGETTSSKAERFANENPFEFKIFKDNLTLESGEKFDTLSLKVRGIYNLGDNHMPAGVVLSRVQISAGPSVSEQYPVICAIEDYQEEKTPFFSYSPPNLNCQYGLFGGWDSWVNIVRVPIDALTFAKRGRLLVVAEYAVASSLSPGVKRHKSNLYLDNYKIGYIDGIEQRNRAKEIAVSLAVFVSGVDGEHDLQEGRIVRDFIHKQLAELDDSEKTQELKCSLNEAAKRAHAIKETYAIRERGFQLAKEAGEFEPNLKFMIMELLLDVAGADDVAEHAETEFLNELAEEMGLDTDEYKNMRDKALPIAMYSENSAGGAQGQVASMLGLTPDMSVQEKKSQLSKEYRKWNALKNSSDPEKSKQAKHMVKVISELRKEL